jgi:hypothetical protein
MLKDLLLSDAQMNGSLSKFSIKYKFIFRLNRINKKLFNTVSKEDVKSTIAGFLMGYFTLIFNSYPIFF